MKHIRIISLFVALVAGMAACSDVRRSPGKIYMPDMAYSRAYETYSEHPELAEKNINYNAQPVNGTLARGQEMPFELPMDKPGDSTNYVASKAVTNPVPYPTAPEMKEAERLYLINCGICHGSKLDGNGPLYKDGNGPYPAKPATLVGDAKYEAMPEGQMYYSIAYGKNLMGAYSSQLSRKQRWQIIHYIKSKQKKTEAAPAGAPAAGDSSKPATAPAPTPAVAKN